MIKSPGSARGFFHAGAIFMQSAMFSQNTEAAHGPDPWAGQ